MERLQNYSQGQQRRLEVELSGTALKTTLQNWATKRAAASLAITRLPALGPHAEL